MSISILSFSLDLFRVGMEQPSLIFSVYLSLHLYLSLCLRTELEMMAPLLQGKIWISDMPTLNSKIIPYEPDSFNWQLHLHL